MSKRKKSKIDVDRAVLTSVIIVALLTGIIVFIFKVYDNPTNVFNGMLEKSLSYGSFEKTVTQISTGQKVTQVIAVQIGASNLIDSTTKLVFSQTGSNFVKTESIGTPTTDYARYDAINTNEVGINGKPLSFTPVLGIWGVSMPSASNLTQGQLFNESVLGVVPIGNLSIDQRSKLMAYIKRNNVYEVVGTPNCKFSGLRYMCNYKVKVQPSAYVGLMKMFGGDLGFNNLSSVDQQAFSSQVPEFEMTIDAFSRELVSDSQVGTSRSEVFNGYGIELNIKVPTKTIPISQLESMVQSIH